MPASHKRPIAGFLFPSFRNLTATKCKARIPDCFAPCFYWLFLQFYDSFSLGSWVSTYSIISNISSLLMPFSRSFRMRLTISLPAVQPLLFLLMANINHLFLEYYYDGLAETCKALNPWNSSWQNVNDMVRYPLVLSMSMMLSTCLSFSTKPFSSSLPFVRKARVMVATPCLLVEECTESMSICRSVRTLVMSTRRPVRLFP